MESLSVQAAKAERAWVAPSLLRVATFLVVKYYAFSIILSFIGARFQKSVLANSQGASDVLANTFFYFIYISWAVLLLGLVLVLPIYLVLRIKPVALRLSGLWVLLVAEYGLYTWAASPSDFSNGLYNAVVSVIFLVLFFRPTMTVTKNDGAYS